MMPFSSSGSGWRWALPLLAVATLLPLVASTSLTLAKKEPFRQNTKQRPEAFYKNYNWIDSHRQCVFPPVDQGGCGNCWAMASARVYAERLCQQSYYGVKVWPSPFLVDDCMGPAITRPSKFSSTKVCEGGDGATFDKFMSEIGSVPLGYYPLDQGHEAEVRERLKQCKWSPPLAVDAGISPANLLRPNRDEVPWDSKGPAWLKTIPDTAQRVNVPLKGKDRMVFRRKLQDEISNYGPVVLAVEKKSSDGKKRQHDGHMVTLHGWKTKPNKKTKKSDFVWLARNSHGRGATLMQRLGNSKMEIIINTGDVDGLFEVAEPKVTPESLPSAYIVTHYQTFTPNIRDYLKNVRLTISCDDVKQTSREKLREGIKDGLPWRIFDENGKEIEAEMKTTRSIGHMFGSSAETEERAYRHCFFPEVITPGLIMSGNKNIHFRIELELPSGQSIVVAEENEQSEVFRTTSDFERAVAKWTGPNRRELNDIWLPKTLATSASRLTFRMYGYVSAYKASKTKNVLGNTVDHSKLQTGEVLRTVDYFLPDQFNDEAKACSPAVPLSDYCGGGTDRACVKALGRYLDRVEFKGHLKAGSGESKYVCGLKPKEKLKLCLAIRWARLKFGEEKAKCPGHTESAAKFKVPVAGTLEVDRQFQIETFHAPGGVNLRQAADLDKVAASVNINLCELDLPAAVSSPAAGCVSPFALNY